MGKLRLVLNLRYVNQFLHVTKFKYEDLRVATLMFERNEHMFKFDLKSGYYHVDVYCGTKVLDWILRAAHNIMCLLCFLLDSPLPVMFLPNY